MTKTTTPEPAGLSLRLLALLRRTSLARHLDQLYERRGRLRVNIMLSWFVISAFSLLAIALVHVLYTAPAVHALPVTSPELSDRFLRTLFVLFVCVLLLVSAATYAMLYHSMVKPLESFRDRIGQRLAESGKQQSSEIAALSYSSQKRMEQLDAALTDNELMRREQQQLLSQHAKLRKLFESTFESITDRLVLVDAQGTVVEISPLTTELISLHRSRVIGENFESLLNLYDPARDNPLEYRLSNLVRDVLDSGSSIPKLTSALLVTPHGQEPILLSVSAILDADARVAGAAIRFENDTHDAGASSFRAAAKRVDRVTGLPGREAFDSRIKELIEQARIRSASHVLMLFAVENIGTIHDTFGHRAGEELYWNIAQVIQGELGAGTGCYRVSTRFIAVLFPFCDRESAQAAGKRVCDAVAGRIFAWRDARYESRVSAGAVEIKPDSEGMELLMERADSAYQQAKSLGGSRVHWFDPDEREQTRRRSDQEWVAWLTNRLESNSLHLISQAIMPLSSADNRAPLFEVFVRIEDEDGVWISPGAFMGPAARYQRCATVDLAVIQKVLDELNRNPEILLHHQAASINLAGCALEDPQFAADVAQAILLSGIPGNRLCFEIDEPYVLSHRSTFMRFVETLRPTGVKFALDHYKAGGALDALLEIPVQYVKIHESMVRRLAGDSSDRASRLALTSINEICHARGIITIAAGIESTQELENLKAAKTDYGQGVLLNKMGPLMV